MNTFVQTLEYFVFITFELVALFMLISAAVEIILMYIPEEKIRAKLSGRGIVGNIMAAGFGALTPFCACSTIPMTVGFLHAGVPFGSTMSFLIASPLLNPIIIGMLGAMVGIEAMVAYFVIAFIASVAFGYLLEKTGMQRYVKNVRLKNAHETGENRRAWPFGRKLREAFRGAWGSLRPIMGYLLIGVALGVAVLLAAVALLLIKKVVRHWTGITACTLILSGGIGNIIDRIVHGYVVDMFDLQLFSYPVFNLADCCVVVGAILGGIYYLFLYEKYDKKKKEPDHAHDPSDPS